MRRHEVVLWVAQRATAVVLALCVAVHLATIVYAMRGGLSAGEILGRTRGNLLWGGFYATFAVCAAVHGAIGLRGIAIEWLRMRGPAVEVAATAVALVLGAAGLRAVYAVVGA